MVAIGRRVLVVEDEFLAALTTVDFLESIGCEVVGPAARLSPALELAQSEALDAAVLDINIAGGNDLAGCRTTTGSRHTLFISVGVSREKHCSPDFRGGSVSPETFGTGSSGPSAREVGLVSRPVVALPGRG
jgi:AmiR/NasT family two-component response regulator